MGEVDTLIIGYGREIVGAERSHGRETPEIIAALVDRSLRPGGRREQAMADDRLGGGTHETGGFDSRIDIASAGLRLARIASAARKKLRHTSMLPAEKIATESFLDSLVSALQVARHERLASKSDDVSFALVDLAMSAFPPSAMRSEASDHTELIIVRLIAILSAVLDDDDHEDETQLAEQIFKQAAASTVDDQRFTGEELNNGFAAAPSA